jgi:hypothetical protein
MIKERGGLGNRTHLSHMYTQPRPRKSRAKVAIYQYDESIRGTYTNKIFSQDVLIHTSNPLASPQPYGGPVIMPFSLPHFLTFPSNSHPTNVTARLPTIL